MVSNYNFKPFKHSSHHKIIDLVERNKKVLDVGCASGYIASILKKKNCYVFGVDNNEEELKNARKHCDEVALLDISKDKINGKYDVIILGDILEHLLDPGVILKKLSNNLNEGGYIIISLPNIANIHPRLSLLLGKFDYTNIGILDKTHLKFFTLKTFRELVRGSGYELISMQTTPIPIHLAFPNIPKSLLNLFYSMLNISSKVWPTMFGYQFVAKVKWKGKKNRKKIK